MADEKKLDERNEVLKGVQTHSHFQRKYPPVGVSTQSNVVPFQHEPTSEDAPTEGPELNAYIAARRPEYIDPPTKEQMELAYLASALHQNGDVLMEALDKADIQSEAPKDEETPKTPAKTSTASASSTSVSGTKSKS